MQGFMSLKSLAGQNEFLPPVFNDLLKPWNEWLDSGASIWSRSLIAPAVNVSGNAKNYKLSVAAPGMKKEDFKTEVNGDLLTPRKQNRKNKASAKSTRRTNIIIPISHAALRCLTK